MAFLRSRRRAGGHLAEAFVAFFSKGPQIGAGLIDNRQAARAEYKPE